MISTYSCAVAHELAEIPEITEGGTRARVGRRLVNDPRARVMGHEEVPLPNPPVFYGHESTTVLKKTGGYIFKNFTVKEKHFTDKRTNATYSSVQFATLTLPCFNHYRDLFYNSENTKIVP